MKSRHVPDGSDRVDDGNGIVVDGSDCLNHPSFAPPQSKVVSVAHISDHDVVKPELTTHTVILLIHRRETFRDRSNLRVCKNDRDVLSPRSGDRSIDIIGEGGGHNPVTANMICDGVNRGDNVLQGVRAGSPSAKQTKHRLGISHFLDNT